MHFPTMTIRETRIAIINRDGLYRDALRCCLATAEGISVVHTACELGDRTRAAIMACNPHLLIVEFGLCYQRSSAQLNGMHNLFAGIKTIVIGVPDTDEDILACIEREGAAGYIPMDSSLIELFNNIHAIMNGVTLCSPRIASLVCGRMSALARRSEVTPLAVINGNRLTRRESEIATLIDEGLSNKEIAVRLHIEVSTVKNHVHNILDKLQLHNRYSAVQYLKEKALPTGHL